MQLQVTDADLVPASGSASLTIASALAITTASLPPASVGVAYSAPLGASGGTPPYTWSATGLPAGIVVNGSQLTGIALVPGPYNVVLQVQDSLGVLTSANLTLVVAVLSAPSITTASLPGGTVGLSYAATLFEASGGLRLHLERHGTARRHHGLRGAA